MKKASKRPKNSAEFDEYFENHDIADLLDTDTKRINIDFPAPILRRIDLKANQLGLTRQALIKYWIAERLNLISHVGK
jgi:predicted DNA binding CopG/RHH family protein